MVTNKSEKAPATNGEKPCGEVCAPDVLAINSVYPDAASVFTSRAITLIEAKDSACVVLDTNALLVPFGIGQQTLAQVEATYQQLVRQKRLAVPAQVAREFAKNRVLKLAELHQKLSRKSDQLPRFQQGSYPLLETIPEYKRIRDLEEQLDRLVGDYRSLIAATLNQVRGWEWNDPVTLLYNRIFSADVVIAPQKADQDIKAEHQLRFRGKIPPGYKDANKEDQGIGDFLIWLAILEIGRNRKSSLIFVTGEEKADWWHRVDSQPLYPRFELVDEYRRASEGHSFHIIKFSQFLELFGASSEVVAEVREEETLRASRGPLTAHSAMRTQAMQAEQAVACWFMDHEYQVSAPPMGTGCDYVVEGPTGPFEVDIVYGRRGGMVEQALRRRVDQHISRRRPSNLSTVVVVVAQSPDVLDRAERAWNRLDPPFRLATGIIGPDERFTFRRPP